MRLQNAQFSHDLDPLAAASYLIRLDSTRPRPDVTQMKLYKLIYLAQANYLAATGRRLVADRMEAFAHGPVPEAIRAEFRDSGNSVLAKRDNLPDADLPEDARQFLDQIWDRYANRTASSLRNLTHNQEPWKRAYRKDKPHCVMPDEEMETYFRTVVPLSQRVLHPSVVVVNPQMLDVLDQDENDIVEQALAALR